MVMQPQEECQSCDDPLLCSDWLIAPDVLPSFMLALGSAACFLRYSGHRVQIGHCIPHQPIVAT